MAISFDGSNKIITLSTGTTQLGVRDLWSRWLDWIATSDNSKYPAAFDFVGGNDIDVTAGTTVPIYLFMKNGWRIRPQEANHTLKVFDGILLEESGNDPFINTIGSFVVRINYSQPVQAITVSTGGGSGGISTGDKQDIAMEVWATLLASIATDGSIGVHVKEQLLTTAKYLALK